MSRKSNKPGSSNSKRTVNMKFLNDICSHMGKDAARDMVQEQMMNMFGDMKTKFNFYDSDDEGSVEKEGLVPNKKKTVTVQKPKKEAKLEK